MNNSEQAVKCFNDGFSCSQAVLSSSCEKYGLSKELAYKVSGAFGSGIAQLGETCGAVTGALMIIGLKYGKYEIADMESKEHTFACVKKYTDIFKQQFGSIKCQDLIKYDISNNSELLEARKAGVFQSICPKLIQKSVEIVESVLGTDI